MKEKKWFVDRIGKRIYRDKNNCDCKVCQRVFKEGLIIEDDQHADYLFMVQVDMGYNYFDKH